MTARSAGEVYGVPRLEAVTPREGDGLFETALPVFAAAVLSLPLIYAFAAEPAAVLAVLSDGRASHIWLTVGATLLVMLWSMTVTGRLDQKLGAVLGRTVVVFGLFALWILVFRQEHSNKVLLTGSAVAAGLGSVTMLSQHIARSPRVALLGDWHPIADSLSSQVTLARSPTDDLSSYDVLLTTDAELSPTWSAQLAKAMMMGKQVRHLAEYSEEVQGIVSIEHFELDHISASTVANYRLRKRVLDLVLIALALPLALPLLLAGMAAVRLTMGAPVFFVQDRIGLGGKVFRIYKLRTMAREQGEHGRAASQGSDDPRITPVGNILRRTRIDELPQLLNVLKGDMSIVGPRPEWRVLGEQYMASLPAYAYRHLVRPGITGWAQVRSGYASNLEETRWKVGYDLFYIKNFSFALDLQILLRTVWTLVSGVGAR